MGAEEDVTPGVVGQPVNPDPAGLASGTPVAPPPPNDPMLDLALAGTPVPAPPPPQGAPSTDWRDLLATGGAPAAPPPAADGYKETVLDPLLSGTPAPGQVPPSGGPPPILVDMGPAGTRFRVDPDEAQKVANTLRDAATEARELAQEAYGLAAAVRAAAADGVSQFAAQRMSQWWAGPEGSFAPTIETFAQRCEQAAVGYDQQLAAYLRDDDLGATTWGRGMNPPEQA